MTRLRQAVGAVGLFGSLLALALVVAPATASIRPVELVMGVLPTDRPNLLVAGIGIVVGVAATALSRLGSGDGPGPLVAVPPEPAQSSPSTTGRALENALRRRDADGEIRETLRATAVETLVQRSGVDRQSARAAVREGTWTDDRLAVALVGPAQFPLRSRLRAWLDPAGERRRRVERTVAAIERLQVAGGAGQ